MGSSGSSARAARRLVLFGVCTAAGLMFATAAATSGGSDLRPSGVDLRSVVADRSSAAAEQRDVARDLEREVERLTASADGGAELAELLSVRAALGAVAGTRPAEGPGVRVVLDDAPVRTGVADVDPNLLVVHEQDIRAFVNALWAGGAEAVALQGQRIVSTTSIRCVGSTVVIDGVPYAPPYRIEAVGDSAGMNFSISTSPQAANYSRYVEQYGLGLQIDTLDRLRVPGHDGALRLTYAQVLEDDIDPGDID